MKLMKTTIARTLSLLINIVLDVYAIYYVVKTWNLVGKGSTNNYTSLLIGIKWLIIMWMIATIIFFSILMLCSRHYHYWQHIPVLRFMYLKSIFEKNMDNNIISSLYLILYGAINVFFTFITMTGIKTYNITGASTYISYVSFAVALYSFLTAIIMIFVSIFYVNNKERRKQMLDEV
jgi:hypothetical protein